MPTFQDHFESLLASHLKKYDFEKLHFEAEVLAKINKQDSDFFCDSNSDNASVYVHWYRNVKPPQSPHVVLIGLKTDIKVKRQEIEKVVKQYEM